MKTKIYQAPRIKFVSVMATSFMVPSLVVDENKSVDTVGTNGNSVWDDTPGTDPWAE